MIFSAEKSLKEYGEKVSEDVKKPIEDAITALKGVKDTDDTGVIESKTSDLSSAMSKIGEELQKAATESSSTTQDSDNVTEAETVDVEAEEKTE